MISRWWRRHVDDADEGAATAEFAVVLPCVAMVAILVLCLGRASLVSMNCQDAAADAARIMSVDSDGDVRARAVVRSVAGNGAGVSFTVNADRVTVVVRCPILSDPTGVLPAYVVGKATRFY